MPSDTSGHSQTADSTSALVHIRHGSLNLYRDVMFLIGSVVALMITLPKVPMPGSLIERTCYSVDGAP